MANSSPVSKRLREHVQANLVGYLALFVAISGTAYAGNKVGSNQIAPNAVKSKHVARNTLTGKDINEARLSAGVLQRRIRSACAAGSAIAGVSASGVPACVGLGGPPSGPASGALTGTYPAPVLAADSVAGSEVVDDSLFQADLGANSVGASEIGSAAVGENEVANGSLRKVDLGVFTGAVSFDPSSLSSGNCQVVSATVPGVALGDIVLANPTTGLDGLVAVALDVLDPGSVDLYYCNPSGATIDGPAETWRLLVIR